jgi:hypothetical protein
VNRNETTLPWDDFTRERLVNGCDHIGLTLRQLRTTDQAGVAQAPVAVSGGVVLDNIVDRREPKNWSAS